MPVPAAPSALVRQTAVPVRRPLDRDFDAARRGSFLFAAACFALPLLLRLYTLKSPVALDPDEAQWTVSARRILDDLVVWRSNDLTTSGPLNGLVASWPTLIGSVPSIGTSRLTGLLLQSGTLFGIARLIVPGRSATPAHAAVLIAALFLAFGTSGAFIHYSSEILSVFLLTVGVGTLARIEPGRSSAARWFLCGLVVTSLPLAKLQSAILAALFGLICSGRVARDVAARRAGLGEVASFAAGAILPVAALVVPPFVVGEGRAVLDGYVLLGIGYGGTRTLSLFVSFAGFIALQAILFLAVSSDVAWAGPHDLARSHGPRTARADLLWLGLCLWPALFLTVWTPGRTFGHYCLYLVIGLPLAVASLQRARPLALDAPRRGRTRLAMAVLAVGALLMRDMVPLAWTANARALVRDGFAADDGGVRSRALYDWTGATPRDALLLWGWEPRLTAYAGLRPADRSAHAEYLIRPNRGREYFRARLLRDLSHSPPALVLDTSRPGYFFNNDPQYDPNRSTIHSFPALSDLVDTGYAPVGGGAGCAALYLRNDLVAALRSSEIALRSSVPRLVGTSMTETCGDWWAPEPSVQAVAALSLPDPEPVRELWILGSRGGPKRDRGTTSVRVAFVGPSGQRSERVVRLFDYPSWTVVEGEADRAIATIEVEPLSFVGDGPAIGAVKAFRDRRPGASGAPL